MVMHLPEGTADDLAAMAADLQAYTEELDRKHPNRHQTSLDGVMQRPATPWPAPPRPATAERIRTAIEVVYCALRDLGQTHEQAAAAARRAYNRFPDPPLSFAPALATVALNYAGGVAQRALDELALRSSEYEADT